MAEGGEAPEAVAELFEFGHGHRDGDAALAPPPGPGAPVIAPPRRTAPPAPPRASAGRRRWRRWCRPPRRRRPRGGRRGGRPSARRGRRTGWCRRRPRPTRPAPHRQPEVVEDEGEPPGERPGGRLPRPSPGPFGGRQRQFRSRSVGRRKDTEQRDAGEVLHASQVRPRRDAGGRRLRSVWRRRRRGQPSTGRCRCWR